MSGFFKSRVIALLCLALISAVAPALAQEGSENVQEKRIALLIGNTAYAPSPGRLPNAVRDVELIAGALKGLGFQVDVQRDLALVPLRRAIAAYTRKLREGGPGTVGFLYYSGHGAADAERGTNYLIPVDANLDQDDLVATSERLETIIETLSGVSNSVMQFVVFDACRSVLAQGGTRSTARGFEPITQRRGMVIVFSTSPREVAFDEYPKGSEHGPFASMFAKVLANTSAREDSMFTDVQNAVSSLTNGRQSPYVLRSPVRDFYFRAGRGGTASAAQSPAAQPVAGVSAAAPAGHVIDQLASLAKNASLTDSDKRQIEAVLGSLRGRAQSPRQFSYYAAGDLLGGSGEGSKNITDYAPHIVFPIANAEAFVNSQIFGFGGGGWAGLGARGGSEFDPRNYVYPWRDNFCESRGWPVPECPAGKGHFGVDIRAGARDAVTGAIKPAKGNDSGPVQVVAIEDGTIVQVNAVGSLVRLVSTDGERQWNYLHLDPTSLADKRTSAGKIVKAGDVLGTLSNFFNGGPNTTYHLHLDLSVRSGSTWRYVNPYMTLVRAYERVWGPGVQVAD